MSAAAQDLTAAKLAELTGLALKDIQAARAAGYIEGSAGKFPAGPALIGLVKWLNAARGDTAGSKPRLVYDSLAQCAAATGIPDSALKMAKRCGCEAFRSNRVDLLEFLRWFFARDDSKEADGKTELFKQQYVEKLRAMRLDNEERERKAKERKGQLLEWDATEQFWMQRFVNPMIAALDAAPKELDREWVEKVLKPLLQQKLTPQIAKAKT